MINMFYVMIELFNLLKKKRNLPRTPVRFTSEKV